MKEVIDQISLQHAEETYLKAFDLCQMENDVKVCRLKDGEAPKTLFELEKPKKEFYDTFIITKVSYNPDDGEFEVYALLSMLQYQKDVIVDAAVIDKNTRELIHVFPHSQKKNEFRIEFHGKAILEKGLKDLAVVARASWKKDEQSDYTQVCQTKFSTHVSFPFTGATYKHVYPKKEDTPVRFGNNQLTEVFPDRAKMVGNPDPDHIVIALYREPTTSSDCDYICKYGMSGSGKPYLAVPGKGTVTLSNGMELEKMTDNQGFTCFIEKISSDGGGVQANNPLRYDDSSITYNCTDNSFEYQIATCWNKIYDEIGEEKRVYFNYYLSIQFSYKCGGVSFDSDIYISSVSGGDYKTLPLAIQYGCLEEHTLIKMMDGSEKQIREIKVGESVLGMNGKSFVVSNIWKGTEKALLQIETRTGKHLVMTEDHPVCVTSGFCTGDKLKVGSVILLENGDEDVVVKKETVAGGIVYNLDLQSGDTFVAAGILVGDMKKQNKQ